MQLNYAAKINNNAINVKRVLSSFPTISVGFVNNLSTKLNFFKETLDPNTKRLLKMKIINLEVSSKLPLLPHFRF